MSVRYVKVFDMRFLRSFGFTENDQIKKFYDRPTFHLSRRLCQNAQLESVAMHNFFDLPLYDFMAI